MISILQDVYVRMFVFQAVSVHVSTSIHNMSNINTDKIVCNATSYYYTNEVSRGVALQCSKTRAPSGSNRRGRQYWVFPYLCKRVQSSILEAWFNYLFIFFIVFPQHPALTLIYPLLVLKLFAGTQYIVACTDIIRSSCSPVPNS